MATITNTAGNGNIAVVPNNTFGQVLFTTPSNPVGQNLIFLVYITIDPSAGYGSIPGGRKPFKYILGPDTTFRWDNPDLNDDLRVQWTWTQMEIQ